MRSVFFIMGILIYVFLIMGCVQTNSPVEDTVPVLVTTSHGISLPVTSPEIIPQYKPGDIIDHTQNIDREPHLIIIDLNNTSGQYQYDIIFRNPNREWGYRIYPEPRWVSVGYFDKNETYLLTHINMTDFETWFPNKEIFEKTR